MDTNRALRKRVRTLVAHGVSQKVIAAKLGTSESWLSRWLRADDAKATSFTVDHMDRLNAYLRELSALLLKEAQPPDSPAGNGFPEPANGTTDPVGRERER